MTNLAQVTNSSATDYVSSTRNQVQRKDGTALDKDAFFKLLITQLRHQDPLKPMDNEAFVAQMAQFSSLEQMQNMNNNLNRFLRIQSLSEGANLIGKTVEGVDPNSGEPIKGKVAKLVFEDGRMYAYLDEQETRIDVDEISTIY